jgi:membrane-associated phospholipid phosphatase
MRLPIDGTFEPRGDSSRAEPWLAAALSLLSAAVAALAFGVVALAVQRGVAAGFDQRAAEAMHALERTWLTAVMVGLTTLASPVMTIALTLFVAWIVFRRYDARAGAIGVAQLAATAAVNLALKLFFHRPRPDLFGGIGEPPSFSFPSWHAMSSVAVFGLLALILARSFPRARVWLGAGAALLAFSIGLSRIYLGMHWPTDVLAGFLAGWILLLGGAAVLDRLPSPERT